MSEYSTKAASVNSLSASLSSDVTAIRFRSSKTLIGLTLLFHLLALSALVHSWWNSGSLVNVRFGLIAFAVLTLLIFISAFLCLKSGMPDGRGFPEWLFFSPQQNSYSAQLTQPSQCCYVKEDNRLWLLFLDCEFLSEYILVFTLSELEEGRVVVTDEMYAKGKPWQWLKLKLLQQQTQQQRVLLLRDAASEKEWKFLQRIIRHQPSSK